jgi:hypothetical protein
MMYAALAAVGVSFLLGRNPTAAILAVSWLACEAIYRAGGNPTDYALFFDLTVVTAIFCKLRRDAADWIILSLFPIAWFYYVAEVTDLQRYWTLYSLQMMQFIAAGSSSFLKYYRSRAVSDMPDEVPFDANYRLAWGRGYG